MSISCLIKKFNI